MLKKKTLLIIPVVLIMTFIITLMTPICVYADNEYHSQQQISAQAQIEGANDLFQIKLK